MSAGTLIINGPLRDPRHKSCSKLHTYVIWDTKWGRSARKQSNRGCYNK